MKKTLVFFSLLIGFVWTSAQSDSIAIDVKLSSDKKKLHVQQKITYQNKTNQVLDSIHLLNWVAAYKNKGTPLAHRKLEDRNTNLHFAKNNQLGTLLNLSVENTALTNNLDQENIVVPLVKPLQPNEMATLQLQYEIQLPDKSFTGYGYGEDTMTLKYFFLVPNSFHDLKNRYYLDKEETANFNTFWKVNWQIPNGLYIESDLEKVSTNNFMGFSKEDPEFVIANKEFNAILLRNGDVATNVVFGYALNEKEKQDLEFFLPLQLKFISDKTNLHSKKILFTEKFKAKEKFFGSDDIKFWKFNFQLFTDAEKTDLDYFGMMSKKILDHHLITDKEKYHWFKNGLKSNLEIQYLQNFYAKTNLLGKLPDNLKIIGIKPLRFFHASKLKLTDRYGLAYQYILAQNLDQKIGEPFSELSNFNDMTISNFEMGTLLNYSADKMGYDSYNSLVKNYILQNKEQEIKAETFLKKLADAAPENEYLLSYLDHKSRRNFKLKKIKKDNDSIKITITKNFDENIPFKLKTINKEGDEKSFWFDTVINEKVSQITLPNDDIYKITLNNGYLFPEKTFGDNFIYTKGPFSNMKKIRFKLLKDIPNPEYQEIYINPRVSFSNAYDKFLIGLNFKNSSLFDQKFLYSITPQLSTGTGKLTGSGGVSYTFLPAESIVRSLSLGASGSYYHYDYDLAYKKFSLSSGLNFRKKPRSTVSRGIGLSYNYYEKDLNPNSIYENDYNKYNLWSLGYGYTDNQKIHEKSLGVSTQWMEDFNKITAEGFYRWEFATKQKLSLRLFAGYFLRNNTRNNLFDYGISRVSNYTFSYNLLGQSATSGFLSQQYVLADGGFKSFIPGTANQWLTAINADTSIWKMFGIYADAGFYKSKGQSAEFIWDTGISVKLVPDFVEVFFPIQSSLGFEPSFKDYGKRIRYTLVLNLSSIINAARRGWF